MINHVSRPSPPDTITMTPGATPPATVDSQKLSASIWLNKVISWDGERSGIQRALKSAFKAEDYEDCTGDLQARGIEPLSWIESLDKVCVHIILGPRTQLLVTRG